MSRRIKSEEGLPSARQPNLPTKIEQAIPQPSPVVMPVSTVPVFATSKQPRLAAFSVPAVKTLFSDGRVSVYPLDREMVGEVWDEQDQNEWSLRELPNAWMEANVIFKRHVDYPLEYVQTLLNTLRTGFFLDNSIITASRWREACRRPSDLLAVQGRCAKCSTVRSFAMRTLLTAPANFPKWKCSQFGLECNIFSDIPIYAVAPDQWVKEFKEESTPSLPSEEQFPSPPIAGENSHTLPVPASTTKFREIPLRRAPHQAFDLSTPPQERVSSLENSLQSNSITSRSFITWTQVPPERRLTDTHSVISTRNPSALRRPAPSHYMIGDPLLRMHEPDPPQVEIEHFSRLVVSKEWKEMRKDLDKWTTTRKTAVFEAKGSPIEVTNWDNMMVTYFSDNVITNSVVQARLASQTFRGQALNWWRAHSQMIPELVVSYEQLLEWIRTELVPMADPATATLS